MNNTKSTKKSKNNKHQFSRQQLATITLSIIVTLLTLAVIAGGFFISHLWSVQKSQESIKTTTLILNAVEGLSSPAPIDPQSGKAYIPQAKLVFPMKPSTIGTDIEYVYQPADSTTNTPEEIRLVNAPGFLQAKSLMITAEGVDKALDYMPQLQGCARGYYISFSPTNEPGETLAFTKTLSDGRQLYASLDNQCKTDANDFEDYIKQVDSY